MIFVYQEMIQNYMLIFQEIKKQNILKHYKIYNNKKIGLKHKLMPIKIYMDLLLIQHLQHIKIYGKGFKKLRYI